jgi:hypothetical protein
VGRKDKVELEMRPSIQSIFFESAFLVAPKGAPIAEFCRQVPNQLRRNKDFACFLVMIVRRFDTH